MTEIPTERDIPDMGIGVGEAANDVERTIATAVVDEDDLVTALDRREDVRKPLIKRGEAILFVEDWNDDGEERRGDLSSAAARNSTVDPASSSGTPPIPAWPCG